MSNDICCACLQNESNKLTFGRLTLPKQVLYQAELGPGRRTGL